MNDPDINKNLEVEELTEEYKYLSYGDIYKELLANEEIIIVIDRAEENRLRRRLSVLKSKDLAKLKDSGFDTDDSKLEFIVIEDKDMPKGRVKIQIVMRTKIRIRVYNIQIPDGDLT